MVQSVPLISLIMTVRDGARYLEQAVASVRAQTLADWELVLWDDGSTDETPAIVTRLAHGEPRIRVHRSSPIGRRKALVEAHRHARGRYLGWIDADDWLDPATLARAHAVLASSGADLVYTDHIVVGSHGERRGLGRRSRIPYSPRRLLIDFMTFHFRLFSRDVFERAGGIDPEREIAIDYDLCLRISEHGRIRHLAEPLYFYREHEQQMSSRQRAAQIEASAAAIRAALARRGLTEHRLEVDLPRGRFRMVSTTTPARIPPARWLRVAVDTALPWLRRPRPARTTRVIGYWPTGPSVYCSQLYTAAEARGITPRAIGGPLASLMRAVWTGNAGDTLHIHGIGPLLDGREPGRAIANTRMFATTLDHALARGMRLVWTSRGPLTTHAWHPEHERWCRRALATRCDAIVTHWFADLDRLHELGGRAIHVPHPDLIDGYPTVSRESARAQQPDAASSFVIAGDVDRHAPREVAVRVAAADVLVLPASFTAGAAAVALSMAKPIVAPSLPRVAEIVGGDAFLYEPTGGELAVAAAIERSRAARGDWDRIERAQLALTRARTWDRGLAVIAGGE